MLDRKVCGFLVLIKSKMEKMGFVVCVRVPVPVPSGQGGGLP